MLHSRQVLAARPHLDDRARKLGVWASWMTWDGCYSTQRAPTRALPEEWLAERGLPELGFTHGA